MDDSPLSDDLKGARSSPAFPLPSSLALTLSLPPEGAHCPASVQYNALCCPHPQRPNNAYSASFKPPPATTRRVSQPHRTA